MNNRKTYIIADFVKILDLPRTTLKDWLTRYEQYIEFDVRGHRKIYFESSLKVLEEIAEMRNAGKNANEIMAELSERHPINPDVTHEIPVKEKEHAMTNNNDVDGKNMLTVQQQREKLEQLLVEKLQDAASELHQAHLASLLPIVKRQHEKVERMLNIKFQDMAENTHSTQREANKLVTQNSRRLLLVIALGFTIIISVIVSASNIYYHMTSQKEEMRVAEENLISTISKNNEQLRSELSLYKNADKEQQLRLLELSKKLEASTKAAKSNIDELKSKLNEQQKAFKNIMDSYNTAILDQRKKEIKQLQESFEKQRGVLLGKIDELAKQSEKNGRPSEDYNEKLLEMKQTINTMSDEIKALKKRKSELEETILEYRFPRKN